MKKINIPNSGMGATEVDLLKVKIKVGDWVDAGDSIAEIETDKTSFDLNTDVSGIVVQVFFKEGDTVPIGKVLCKIDDKKSKK